MLKEVERLIELAIYSSRWLQAPLYLGLIVTLIVLIVTFFTELVHLTAVAWTAKEGEIVLYVLTLVDVVMVANLIVMVMISGYENFVSRIDVVSANEKLAWFGKLDHGSLKIKLASSIVAISAIHLLKAFLNAEVIGNDKLILLIIMHLTFVISALLLALIDRVAVVKEGKMPPENGKVAKGKAVT
jgi:uncharacterized protein (TIGR00645 family)